MKYKDLPKNRRFISRDAFSKIIIKLNDENLINATVIVPNYCPPALCEGSCSYKTWRGQYEKLYKEDLEADDWFYY